MHRSQSRAYYKVKN